MGVAQYFVIIVISHDYKIGSHFVGQKKNEINRVTLISQHSIMRYLRTRKLANIDFKHT